jgi:hexosaminidase
MPEMNSDFLIKGFHVDLRIQATPMTALRRLASDLADFGLNALLIEWEATYPYDKHVVISNEYAYTREEVRSFISYCARLGIQVIPLQQCFGHVEYILRHERYTALRESHKDLCQVCPLKDNGAYQLFGELLADLASAHPSQYIHIGGDETYLLGHCPLCHAKAERDGKSRLYVDYFKGIAQSVVRLGKRPLVWADMLLKHPAAVGAMPKETIFVDWNYGWRHDRFGDITQIQTNGFELWGAAALRCSPDNHSLTSWEKHFHNVRDYIPHARRHGCRGIFLTSWSTSGTYDYEWDQNGEVVEVHPMRQVYPLAGFRVLLAAYATSLKQEEPIVPEDFVRRYAVERFGLSLRDGTKLWRALTCDATPIQPGVDLEALHSQAQKSRLLLASLTPRRHGSEFLHLRLMADFREFHARFKKLESEIQSGVFSPARIPQKARALARLIEESETLDEQFLEANRGFLYDQGLLEFVGARSKKLRKLYDRLTRAGRKPAERTKPTAHLERSRSRKGGTKELLPMPPRPPSPLVAAG